MDMKRILLVTDLWFSHPNGVATFVSNIKEELEKLGQTVDILEPGRFFTIPLFWFYPDMRLPIFSRGRVRRMIQHGNYDYVHIETEFFLGIYARRACIKLGIPFTTSLHGQHHMYAKKWIGDFMEKAVIRLIVWFHSAALATFVSNAEIKAQLENFGLKQVFLRGAGVNKRFFTRGTCPIEMEKPIFMYMGRVSLEKNIVEFLSADVPGTKLVVGDGPERKNLQKQFPKARFVGAHSGDDLINWCSCADVMVMPSHTEVFSMAVLECLALGIPVATHDAMGQRDIIKNGVNGWIDDDIGHAALQCLSVPRESCQESVRSYSWAVSAETFLSDLERVHRK
jgi:glycosyltransferase involved in cell wall biosynthesis